MKKIISIICILTMFVLFVPYQFAEESEEIKLGPKETTILLSVLFPGLGQFYSGQKIKGAIFAGTTILTITLSAIMYNIANQTYEDYKATGNPYDPLYDDYLSQITMTNVFLGLTGAIWAFNIIDAYFGVKTKSLSFELKTGKDKIMLTYIKKF